ncbi:diaminobutyrate--2-oxoglutarate transaminase [Tepidicaulis sp.]|jgi:diaminobutyrate-2-oxoglutarate transaminase|uniref:diaminobutyrate--2-oxoglutarate transaminase n=1 Tax=Tepidicaulis sp. TaxID=1920809 RepID=UPI003B590236
MNPLAAVSDVDDSDTSIFARKESNVQTYARSFPVVFGKAQGAHLYDVDGKEYIDFLAGAGTLNYGHNNPELKKKLLEYIEADGIAHGLDMHTDAKEQFLEALEELILKPRGLDYMVQFTGPTGANAVEAAMKLARKVTGRHNIISFTNGFHGVTMGALSATGNGHHRGGAGLPLAGVTRMPFANYLGEDVDTIDVLEKMVTDPSSGVDMPAAVIFEAVQGEGGLNAASMDWIKKLAAFCKRHDILLISDDIQAGCGRTGTFFSWEPAGITPDIVTLSKSLSGYGLPFAIVLISSELDIWKPGEHNGTFRGNNHAFVTATAALKTYWKDDSFAKSVREKGDYITKRLNAIIDKAGGIDLKLKGRGMMQGIECPTGEFASEVTSRCFKEGLIIETAGPNDEVVKCLIPLIIDQATLEKGLDILEKAFAEVVQVAGRKKHLVSVA